MWERAFRRLALPVAYSEGFAPRPRVSFGLALPTGYESVAEYLDVELADLDGLGVESDGPDGLIGRLSAVLPAGVDATGVAVLSPGTPSLQEDVTSCSWRWVLAAADGCPPLDPPAVAERVRSALAAPELVVSRHRKGVEVTEDIRPGVAALEVEAPTAEGVVLSAELAAAPRAVRPSEVLAALGPGLEARQVRRTAQWITRPGRRLEPLEAARDGSPAAPRTLERAS
jgi:radical SAM-linked protein